MHTTNSSFDPKTVLTEMASEAQAARGDVQGDLAGVLADWIVPEYAKVMREQLVELPAGKERFEMLRKVLSDLAVLRRGDHSAARIALAQAKVEEMRRRREIAEAEEERIANGGGLTEETLARIERELNLM